MTHVRQKKRKITYSKSKGVLVFKTLKEKYKTEFIEFKYFMVNWFFYNMGKHIGF
jgi:hypothetical protein